MGRGGAAPEQEGQRRGERAKRAAGDGVSDRVTIEPESFTLVDFDREELAGVVESLLDAIGLDRSVVLEIDQTTPLGEARVVSLEPDVRLFLESGAIEDPKRLRQLTPSGAANVLGRLLFRVRDRLDPAFGDPPPDGDLGLERSTAWDVYAVGRLVRLGFRHENDRQRRLYQFRTRHGFHDASDAAFEALWAGDALTWADVERLSAEALAGAAA